MADSQFQSEPVNILLVDDEYDVRFVLKSFLKQKGDFEFFEAINGVAAQDIIKREKIDLVITDLVMPRMGGLKLMEWAKGSYPSITWIILSGRGSFDNALKAVELGAFNFITKPVSLEALWTTVRNALTQRNLKTERERLLREIEQKNLRLEQQLKKLHEKNIA